MEAEWKQFLNVDTLVLSVVFAVAACTALYFAMRKRNLRIGLVSLGFVLALISVFWGASTYQAWNARSGAWAYLKNELARIHQGETPEISPYATEEQKEAVLTNAPRIGYPVKSATYVDFFYGTCDFRVETLEGESHWVRVNAFPPGGGGLFSRPDFSLHDIQR